MHKVIKDFADLQDKGYVYRAGDKFPREGFEVSDERIEELATAKNRRGIPLIEVVDEPEVDNELATEEEIAEDTVDESTDEVESTDKADEADEVKPKRGRKKKNAD